MLTEKYRPKTVEEWVGDKEVLEKLQECILESIPALLEGPPGSGKTSAVYLMANELGYSVVEFNASDERKKSDLKEIKVQLRMKPFQKTLFLLDEADGIENQDALLDIVKTSVNPIVLTINDGFKLSSAVKKSCKLIEVVIKPSQLGLVVKRLKTIAEKENMTVSFQGITTDIRESINKVFNSSHGYEKDANYFEKVERIFKMGKYDEEVPVIWLIDNAANFYSGKELFQAIGLLMLYSQGCKEALQGLPKAKHGKTEYPYFLKKLSRTRHEFNR